MPSTLGSSQTSSCTSLLQVVKIRMALRKTNEYNGIADCCKRLFRSEGIKGFYRGYMPNLLGILPYAGIDLAVYEVLWFLSLLLRRMLIRAWRCFQTLKRRYLSEYHSDGTTPPAVSLLAFGTFSSCCGQVAAYPLALIRTKLQSQGEEEKQVHNSLSSKITTSSECF